tara:strand:- start:860 stop:1231 length:372 start_codon:yes stop_codon:yes gene_type:complete
MNKDRLALIIVLLGLSVLFYLGWVVDTYRPATSSMSQSEYTPEKVTNKDLEQYGPVLPELSEEELAVSDSLHKSYVKEAEQESERKSIESMRDEVIKILDEVVEEDSTVTITFDMQWTPSWVN